MAPRSEGDTDARERMREFIRNDGWRMSLASYAYKASQRRDRRGNVVTGWHPYMWMRKVARIIEREILKGNARIIVNAPPRSGKSELICHWLPTWYLDLFPDRRVIAACYGDKLAHMWGRKVRDEFLTNPNCLTRLRDDSQAISQWMTQEGGGMRSTGVGGPLIGLGGDLQIIDDPHKNWEEAVNPNSRERLVEWYLSTFLTRLEPGASIVILQQRWHENDLTGYLLKEQPGRWTHINLPAMAEENDILGRAVGESLIPERLPVEKLVEIKKIIGSMLYAAMYQQRPVPLEGGIIKPHWLRYWSPDDTGMFGKDVHGIPQDGEGEWIQSWDLAFKETRKGSYVVGQLWRKLGARRILMDQIRDRMDFPAMLQAVAALSKKWPQARKKIVEEKADGAALIATLRNVIPGLVPHIPRGGSKEARLFAVSPYFEAGNVELPLPELNPWVREYVEELLTFPNAEHDDQVDATSQALEVLADRGAASAGKLVLDLGWGGKAGVNAIGASSPYELDDFDG